MNPLCLQTDWVNFMQILCLFEILTQTYMKQPLDYKHSEVKIWHTEIAIEVF